MSERPILPPTIVTQALYDKAVEAGYDVRHLTVKPPIPEPEPLVIGVDHGDDLHHACGCSIFDAHKCAPRELRCPRCCETIDPLSICAQQNTPAGLICRACALGPVVLGVDYGKDLGSRSWVYEKMAPPKSSVRRMEREHASAERCATCQARLDSSKGIKHTPEGDICHHCAAARIRESAEREQEAQTVGSCSQEGMDTVSKLTCPTCGHEKLEECTCDPKWPSPETVRHNARLLFSPRPSPPETLPTAEHMAEYQRLKR